MILIKEVINTKDSEKTKPLFDKACDVLDELLDGTSVADKKTIEAAYRSFSGHIKVRNNEVRESSLRFLVQRNMAETTKELKGILTKTLPEYANA